MKRAVLLALSLCVLLSGVDAEAARHKAHRHKHRTNHLSCHEDNIDALFTWADKAYNAGQFTQSKSLYQCALRVTKQWETYTPEMSLAMQRIAKVDMRQGRPQQAEALLKELMALDEANMGPYYRDVGVDSYLLGKIYEDQNRWEEAAQMYQKALTILSKSVGPSDRDLPLLMTTLANVYRQTGQEFEAETLESKAKEIEAAAI
jgi:tetratricopeptide (TPR) repeat protein